MKKSLKSGIFMIMKTQGTGKGVCGRYPYDVSVVLFLILLGTSSATAGQSADRDKNSSPGLYKQSSATLRTSKALPTTQKAYTITNDGSNENSKVLEYDSKPALKAYQDDDSDGRFGENEAGAADLDLDGRTGEREAQIGNENVTQHQKVTTLNNMGFGNSLSTFKAAGQTQRSSIFVKNQNSTDSSQPPPDSEKNADSKSAGNTASAKTRVLVS